ncbi:MAG TPA: hypothetical protein PK680_06140 [Novosphingobium sp.]|nr:hypothetical protein [Novosphingobium sp.]HQA17947.1 hypothetical protein [Novosphingobium sp.]
MRRNAAFLTAALALALPSLAQAQTVAGDTDSKTVGIVGTVPAMCFGGTLSGDGTFDLGVLVDLTTGQLRTDLAAPDKVLLGSYCTSRSSITVSATPLEAQNYVSTPPSGFSRTVHYLATASGWTTTPASYDTGAATNNAATQTRNTAFTGDITVAISNFSTSGGSTLRLVGDDAYRGVVTVTLAAVN